jgi:hypothetical protein
MIRIYLTGTKGSDRNPIHDLPGDLLLHAFAGRRHKPLMIAEATPRRIGVTHGEESWRRWFAPCFEFIERNDVRAFYYINWDWESIPMFRGQGWGDTRIQMNEYVKSERLKETNPMLRTRALDSGVSKGSTPVTSCRSGLPRIVARRRRCWTSPAAGAAGSL